MEEELVCEKCNGVGTAVDSSGHADVCDKCFGLGYVKEVYRPGPLSNTKIKLKKAVIYTFIALTIYYAGFSYSFIEYSLTPLQTLIILLIGHISAVSFLIFYVLFLAVKEVK